MAGFTVRAGEHDTHAGSLNGVADRVQQAGERGGAIDFGIDTFGIIGQAFSLQARQVSSEAAQQISRYAGDIRDLATAVRTAGATYVAADADLSEPFRAGEGA